MISHNNLKWKRMQIEETSGDIYEKGLSEKVIPKQWTVLTSSSNYNENFLI